MVLVYAADRERGDALVDRIRSMTKEVEVGDEFTGKVVKTTTFGAFVELAKGTDGLLHISNVAPGRRIATVEEVLNKGDEVSVKVVEVDRERGRIGLRLAEDPEIQGKNAEELSAIAAAEQRSLAAASRRIARAAVTGGRATATGADPVTATVAVIVIAAGCATVTRTARAPSVADDRKTAVRPRANCPTQPPTGDWELTTLELGRPDRDGGNALRPVRVARVLDRHRLAVRVRAAGRACRTCWSICCSRARRSTSPWRSTRSSTAWAPS